MIKAAIISVILSLIVIQDHNLKMHIALLLTEIFDERLWTWFRQKLAMCKKKQISIPDATKDYDFNPLFDRLQSYIAFKYVKSIESCELVPKNGDIEFDIKDMTGKKFKDTYITPSGTEHEMEIHVTDTIPSISSSTASSLSLAKRHIVISSKTASPDDIKNYVRKVSNTRFNHSNIIKIYRPIVRGKKKDELTIEWENVTVRTNKTLENTVYSETITKDLFDDLDSFMSNEAWYARRGIPYKRGYFLHSTPGQGKTSVAKIIANKYGIPIFCLDLTIINDNATLTKMMTELNYFVNDEKYILLMEDAERAGFFNDRYREPALTMDCFLNAIDGVVEPHGRIIIMTANDPGPITCHKALMRPGRIDKIMELKSCDTSQLRRLYDLFYADLNTEIDWDCWKLKEDLSAAYVMKLLQENIGRPEVFLRIIGTKIKNSKKKPRAKTDKIMDKLIDKTVDGSPDNLTDTTKISGADIIHDSDEPIDIVEDHDVEDGETDGEELSAEAMQAIENAKEAQEREENNGDNDFGGSRRRRSNRRKRSNKIEDRVRNAKRTLKRTTRRLQISQNMINRTASKLPILLAKLQEKQEKETRKKLIAKGKKRTEYMKRLDEENKQDELISMIVDEEEYETPAFMMNSIAVGDVPSDTIVTYETLDE
jgi:chaperone BCS1